jgi:uncharacterized protein (TIGR03435 family)
MRYRLGITLIVAVLAPGVIITAAQNQPLKFEVVSIRPCQPDKGPNGMRPMPGGERYVAGCGPLRPTLWTSYWLQPGQVVGGPDWIDKDNFYIEGVAARPSTIGELHVMMQNALAERFNLQFHHEFKDVQAYVLTLDKDGPKNLRVHAPTNGSDLAIDRTGEGLQEKWVANSSPMDFFVWRLGLKLSRPIVDQTGLRAGGYDFELSFTNELPVRPPGALPPTLDTSGPTIFQALREQLGLKLDARKAPVEVLIIDHAEKPDAN